MPVLPKLNACTFFIALLFSSVCPAQEGRYDSIPANWSWHFQSTVIAQKHSGFRSLYSGVHSLADSVEPAATSLSGTLFIGRRLWHGAAIYFNPEVTGGKGLSFATGVAGALNGETYRVGHVEPQVYIARAYLEQYFALGSSGNEWQPDDQNQLADYLPINRLTIRAGKFALSDFYDDNSYAKDPRTQFFNWSIWANGAWDYPANTRGYTYGLTAEWVRPGWAVRISSVAVPRIANDKRMEYKWGKAHSETLEVEHSFSIRRRPGALRLTLSHTRSKAPSYASAIQALAAKDSLLLNVMSGDAENDEYKGKKTAIILNFEQAISNSTGIFSRIGWNDGKYASWAFTEIDHTLSAGVSIKGNRWKRPGDVVGIAGVLNGISKPHRNFLAGGGYGFLLGDGGLNYGNEAILETFYNAQITTFFQLSADYQFVQHPGYNKDRGPVHVFALRAHVSW